MYWCWSRHDVSEDTIQKELLSTSVVDVYELTDLIKKPFSIIYKSNGTHYKCGCSEEWGCKWVANAWYILTNDNTSSCVTNTSMPVNVKFKATDNKL